MKVLITSGGTKIKIDMVRHISNMSKGTFGTKIAESFRCELNPAETDHYVKFLMARDSKYPSSPFVTKYVYETFEDYERELFDLLKNYKPDIVVLAAAVSDYGVENYVDGKIRSKEELVIRLKPLPKLISRVRDYVPNAVICGFKLLVNSTEEELQKACLESLYKNRLDLVVGNDLRDIKNDDHKLLIAHVENLTIKVDKYSTKNGDVLHDKVMEYCLAKAKERNII